MGIIQSILPIIARSGGGEVEDTSVPASIEETVFDAGGVECYNGFPYSGKLSSGFLISMWKQAVSHVDTGPLMFSKRTAAGWQPSQVQVGATLIECAAITMNVLSSGRVLVVYQDNDGSVSALYQEYKIVYSDDEGETWNYGDTYLIGDGGTHANSMLGRPLELPSGKVLIPYYRYPLAGGISYVKILETTDGGETLTSGATIHTQTGGPYPNEATNEVGWIITDNTGVDATTKIAALLRNDVNGIPYHVRSSDGGATWSTIPGSTGGDDNNRMYEFSGTAPVPFDPIIFDGLVYIFSGVRFFPGGIFDGSLNYVTCTPSDFYNNTGYSSVVILADTQAELTGSSTDWGYPSSVVDHYGDLVIQFYDRSAIPSTSGNPRAGIYQKVIPA